MKQITTWMVIMVMAVAPLMAQEAEPSANEEQQIDQVIEEATGGAEQEPAGGEQQEWTSGPVQWESSPQEEHQTRQPREVQTLMTGSGGFGALSIGYTEINRQPSVLMGARAEWVLGHGFGVGIAGVGFASDQVTDGEYRFGLAGGYGGLVMEPIILGWFPVHIALPVLIGAGGVSSYAVNADYSYNENYEPEFMTYAAFFVAEVGAELEFNLVRSVRLTLFGNYRWTPDLEMRGYYGIPEPYPDGTTYKVTPDAMTGWSAGVRFKFGSF
jgi:hypothetical protein